ncbi:MAG TPA: hypothetical protein VGC00_11615 [Thermoanaerobaculia bacterium]
MSARGRRRRASARALLAELAALRLRFGGEAAGAKRRLLAALASRRLATADDVLRLHDLLVFWRAYPDDAELLAAVERQLARFGRRADLRRCRRALADSGIAGCDIAYPFFYATAVRLAERYPDRLRVDWPAWEARGELEDLLHLLLPYSESPMVDEESRSPREWLALLKGRREADGAFLARRFAALAGDELVRETLFERLSPAMVLAGGPATPSHTRAKAPVARIAFQRRPLAGGRPALGRFLAAARPRIRELSPRAGALYVELARDAMVTRSRDLDAFAWGDARDVRLVEHGEGLALAVIGQIPERRLVLESVYGALTLKNGVPIGYVLLSSLFGSTEIAYNVFDAYRDAEAAAVFARVVATARAVFGATSFSIDPYQLGGFGNDEGLASGAWWFYYKLGFRPRDRDVRRVLRGELAAMRKDPGHRSSRATLARLAAEHVFLDLGAEAGVALGALSPGRVGRRVAERLAARYGADRERGLDEASAAAAARLGVRSFAGWSPGERLWWRRWSPLVALVPDVERWSAAERRAAVRVVRAKGGRRESEYVRRFDAHPQLRRALLRLATPE